MDAAKKAQDAVQAGQYDVAVAKYTEALASQPTAVSYYIGRSTAYQRLSPPNLEAALQDAEIAVNLAHKRQKRELIGEAQHRRAVALFALGQYANAGHVFGIVKKFNENEKTLPMWAMKIESKLKNLPEGDEALKVTAVDVPDTEPESAPKPQSTKSSDSSTTKGEQKASATPSVPQLTPADKVRHDWYSSGESVTISILAKGVPKDKVTVEIEERSLAVSFPTANSTTYEFNLDPLFAPVVPDQSTYNVTPSKVEIILKKATSGLKWSALESTDESLVQSAATKVSAKPTASAPSYPTSSRSGPKDWDKVANDLTKPKDTSADSLEDDEEGGDPANAFFRKLYQGADPDTRRAMMKSFQESNGTALSTNWAEVSKAKVETSPPEGMEAKQWEA
ncbi:sgt1 and cs domain containing protein [Diplodia corticola]|uniref:Sgt1 and cs domain containing protein n=1 Tax=Diplodia corticola TaxID=236234 RepID=A0A1J9RKC4_9PEZI|nr:sgt1 and cs domain containing protein [Diplodia corticola]OJD33027.1 sgt1 and cs domain containing protein [Diplodia corticola]